MDTSVPPENVDSTPLIDITQSDKEMLSLLKKRSLDVNRDKKQRNGYSLKLMLHMVQTLTPSRTKTQY